ncbi:MAG: hypothetical protein II348_03785 [Clostridia bacterium]|nr:hypothetical protein [Clostridia bacterium]
MLFSEKMSRIPQPHRAELWQQYRTLCSALAINVQIKKENRTPSEQELAPLREAAKKADEILLEFGQDPCFFPHRDGFWNRMLEELTAVKDSPTKGDGKA